MRHLTRRESEMPHTAEWVQARRIWKEGKSEGAGKFAADMESYGVVRYSKRKAVLSIGLAGGKVGEEVVI